MLFYFGLAGLVFALYVLFNFWKYPKKNLVACCLLGTIFFLVSALRKYTVGTDTPNYWNMYLMSGPMPCVLSGGFSVYEPGFWFFAKVIRGVFGENPQWLLVWSSLIIIFGVSFFIYRNSPNVFFSFLLFLFLMYWFEYLTMMRAAMAYAFLLVGYEFLKKKQWWWYLPFVVVAFFFHMVSIVSALILFVIYIKPSKTFLIASSLAGLLISACIRPAFILLALWIPKYTSYLGSNYATTNYLGSSMHFIVALGLFLFALLVYKQKDAQDELSRNPKNQTEYEMLLNIALIFAISSSFEISISLMQRLSSVFSIYGIVLIPKAFDLLKRVKPKTYRIFLPCAGIALIGYFVLVETLRPAWTSCVPYSFFWN